MSQKINDTTLVPLSGEPSSGPEAVSVRVTDPRPPSERETGEAEAGGSTSSGERSRISGEVSMKSRLIAGRYELLGMVGAGAMGTVYRARDRELDEEVALKVLQHDVLEAPGALDRFRREVKLARRVTHRNVARAHDIGEHQGEHFITMELIDGQPLAQLITNGQPISPSKAIAILKSICQGLDAAHAVGVVHCDLKPDNVLIAHDGRVVITDFGIARGLFDLGVRRTLGGVLGTPAYMAPEQVEGLREVGPAADIYALGVILFELFTGQLPWRGESVLAVAAARLHQPPPDPRSVRPGLTAQVAELILRCLARTPSARYASARELEAALGALRVEELTTAPLSVERQPTVISQGLPEAGFKTLAVLPFRSSNAGDDAYLAEGLTEDIIDQLSMVAGLRVRPRGAVMHLRDPNLDAREAGRQLGVHVVAEGSLRRMGEHLRVSTRLISVSDGFQIWAKRADRRASEMLTLSDELAQAMAEALTVEATPPARETPTDPRALDAYFRGRFEYHKFQREALDTALAHFEQARALAPDDPMILAGYALVLTRLWFFGNQGGGEQARAAAERALALAPGRGEPLVALSALSFLEQNTEQAVRQSLAALALMPWSADAHELLGKILVETGPVSEGIAHYERAIQLDGAFHMTRPNIARALALSGRWGEAWELLTAQLRHPDTTIGWVLAARMFAWQRDAAGARALLNAPEIVDGKHPFAEAILRFCVDPRPENQPYPFVTATFSPTSTNWRARAILAQTRCEFALGLGNLDEASGALEQAVKVGLIDLLWLTGCPILEPLRSTPIYQDSLRLVRDRARTIRAAAGLPLP
jgi:serine/threonine-protein kinase